MGKEKEVSQDLMDEIDSAVEEAGASQQDAPPADDGKVDDLPPDEDAPGDKDNGDEAGDAPPKPKDDGGSEKDSGIGDELLERAVKAGFPLSEAREFSAKALESVLARMEDPGGEPPKKDSGKGDDSPAEIEIPDLDPDDYDEKLVTGFKAMKEMINSQRALINELKGEMGRGAGEWFDGQVEDLAPEYRKALETPERHNSLREKFDVLSAGYKAAGKDVGKGTIFEEATAMVLGDVGEKLAAKAKAEALRKRGSQHISRPAGNRVAPMGDDAFGDVAEELDKKFFNKQ